MIGKDAFQETDIIGVANPMYESIPFQPRVVADRDPRDSQEGVLHCREWAARTRTH